MKEKIFNNLSLKILSAVLAVVLWTIIVNIYDPTMGYTFSNVPVLLVNTDILDEKDYSYEVVEGSKISVYVSGPKSVITDIKASDIVATADVSKISAFTDYVDIKVHVEKNGQILSTVEASPRTSAVKLNIENRETKTINISTDIIGKPSSGYSIVSESINPTYIKVTGPSSVMENVSEARIEYSVIGASDDLYGTSEIKLYNSDGDVIDASSLELSQTTADYKVVISRTKTVPIEVLVSGTPANGYSMTGLNLNINQITIAGSSSEVAGIEKIVIPAANVNITGLNADKVFRFNLSNYVSENLTVLSDPSLVVTVQIQSDSSKNVVFDTSKVVVKGLDSTLNMEYADATFLIKVKGAESIIENLKESDITVTLDLSSHNTAGKQSVKATVKLPEGVSLDEDCIIDVKLSSTDGN